MQKYQIHLKNKLVCEKPLFFKNDCISRYSLKSNDLIIIKQQKQHNKYCMELSQKIHRIFQSLNLHSRSSWYARLSQLVTNIKYYLFRLMWSSTIIIESFFLKSRYLHNGQLRSSFMLYSKSNNYYCKN